MLSLHICIRGSGASSRFRIGPKFTRAITPGRYAAEGWTDNSRGRLISIKSRAGPAGQLAAVRPFGCDQRVCRRDGWPGAQHRATDCDGGFRLGLEVGGAPFFLHEANPGNSAEGSPEQIGATSTRIELFADDPGGVLKRAIAAGATLGSDIEEHQTPWGTHRQGGFRDPFGHNWSVGDTSPLRQTR